MSHAGIETRSPAAASMMSRPRFSRGSGLAISFIFQTRQTWLRPLTYRQVLPPPRSRLVLGGPEQAQRPGGLKAPSLQFEVFDPRRFLTTTGLSIQSRCRILFVPY